MICLRKKRITFSGTKSPLTDFRCVVEVWGMVKQEVESGGRLRVSITIIRRKVGQFEAVHEDNLVIATDVEEEHLGVPGKNRIGPMMWR